MKILHTSITVKNMDQSIAFYQNILGLKLLSRREIPENKAEIAFLGDGETDSRIELTYWLEKTDWTEGDELDHLAFAVPDMDAAMTLFKNNEVISRWNHIHYKVLPRESHLSQIPMESGWKLWNVVN